MGHAYTDWIKQLGVGFGSILSIQFLDELTLPDTITFVIQTLIGILTIVYLTTQIIKKWKK